MRNESPLQNAWEKLKWSEKHIDNLDSVVCAFNNLPSCRTVLEEDPSSGGYLLRAVDVKPVPVEISLAMADVIQSLRPCLDYVAHELWRRNGSPGGPKKRVYFPIGDSPDHYASHAEARIRLFGEKFAKAIDAIEPYKGGRDYYWCLRELDNLSKHRRIATTAAVFGNVEAGSFVQAMLGASTPLARGTASITTVPLGEQLRPVENDSVVLQLPPPPVPNAYDNLEITIGVLLAEACCPPGLPIQLVAKDLRTSVEDAIAALEHALTSG